MAAAVETLTPELLAGMENDGDDEIEPTQHLMDDDDEEVARAAARTEPPAPECAIKAYGHETAARHFTSDPRWYERMAREDWVVIASQYKKFNKKTRQVSTETARSLRIKGHEDEQPVVCFDMFKTSRNSDDTLMCDYVPMNDAVRNDFQRKRVQKNWNPESLAQATWTVSISAGDEPHAQHCEATINNELAPNAFRALWTHESMAAKRTEMTSNLMPLCNNDAVKADKGAFDTWRRGLKLPFSRSQEGRSTATACHLKWFSWTKLPDNVQEREEFLRRRARFGAPLDDPRNTTQLLPFERIANGLERNPERPDVVPEVVPFEQRLYYNPPEIVGPHGDDEPLGLQFDEYGCLVGRRIPRGSLVIAYATPKFSNEPGSTVVSGLYFALVKLVVVEEGSFARSSVAVPSNLFGNVDPIGEVVPSGTSNSGSKELVLRTLPPTATSVLPPMYVEMLGIRPGVVPLPPQTVTIEDVTATTTTSAAIEAPPPPPADRAPKRPADEDGAGDTEAPAKKRPRNK